MSTTVAAALKKAAEQKPLPLKLTAHAWNYREVGRFTDVLFTVPSKDNDYMSFIAGHTFETTAGAVLVFDHWKHGQVVQGRKIVNRHFHHVPDNLLGQKTVGDVVVTIKERGTQRYLLIDYHHNPDGKPLRQLKFIEGGEIMIPGLKTGISVVDR